MTALRLPKSRMSQPRSGVAQGASAPERDELRLARQGYMAVVIVAAAVQLLIFSGYEDNLVSTLLALCASLLGIHVSLNSRRFRAQPISALMLLFFTTTATAGALIVKTAEWSPIADRLTVPIRTFAVLFATQVVLVAADQAYLRFQPLHAMRSWLTRRIMVPVGLMRWPSDLELWILGALGCVSVIMTGTDYESAASFGLASAGAKVFRAFGFFKYAPFLIPFRESLSGFPARPRLPLLSLGGYFVLLVALSFATNSRSTFADAVPTVGICVLIAVGLGRLDFRRIPPSRIIFFLVIAGVGSILLSRVALAMVVVRDYRYNLDAGALVGMTVEALFNNDWLTAAKAKMEASVNVGNYSETYVDSRFAARFLLTKFHDNILYYFSVMGPDQIVSYKEFMSARLLGTLPDPLLRLFGISIDKQDLIVSNGDYVVYLVDGWGLGGFKTGSIVGEIFGVFPLAFPLVVFGCALLLFVVYDAFVVRTARGRVACAPLILLLIWNLCGTTAAFGLGAESVTTIPAAIVRGVPQNIIVYLVVVVAVRWAVRFAGRGGG